MSDVLIRDVPDDALPAIDARAGRLGLSRVEYLCRGWWPMRAGSMQVQIAGFARFGDVFADLTEPDVMGGARV